MIRILGVYLPENKKILYALTLIYGIGISRATQIIKSAKIESSLKVYELKIKQINLLRQVLSKYTLLENNLKRSTNLNIRRLIEIKSYRGRRHIKRLPVRGQRTKTNASRKKKIKKTMFKKVNAKKNIYKK
uniref:Ribosomal protein S13 n=1 Tax=Nitzschia sp. NIES-3576 TaxID=2083273 RepID=A0A2Z5ZAP7_9STRA|nr:ribosomal protein S13 [Nitzschia sp. NIES-3576]